MAGEGTALESTWKAQSELPDFDEYLVEAIDEVNEKGVIGNYEILRLLGEGEFASVWECRSLIGDGTKSMALKAIKKCKVQRHACILKSKRNIRRVNMEVFAMRQCNHAGICHLFDTMQSISKVYLVMEIGERDLFTFIDDFPDGCPELIVKQIMRILALALRHCHQRGIAHRDIKPENLLICGNPEEWIQNSDAGIIKLCDFGLCARIKPGLLLTDFVGSPGFFAPELMTRRQYDGALADAWSLGAVLIELCLGHNGFNAVWCPPYERLHDVNGFAAGIFAAVHRLKFGGEYFIRLDSDSDSDGGGMLMSNISINHKPPRPAERRVIRLSEPVLQLLDKLLQIEPERRASVEQVCTARWFELLRVEPDGFTRLLRLTLDRPPIEFELDDPRLRRAAYRETPRRADRDGRETTLVSEQPSDIRQREVDDEFAETGTDEIFTYTQTNDPMHIEDLSNVKSAHASQLIMPSLLDPTSEQ